MILGRLVPMAESGMRMHWLSKRTMRSSLMDGDIGGVIMVVCRVEEEEKEGVEDVEVRSGGIRWD